MPFMSPKQVLTKNGRISGMEFLRTEQNDEGEWIEDEEQLVRVKADFIISAFGSGLTDDDGGNWYHLSPLDPFLFLQEDSSPNRCLLFENTTNQWLLCFDKNNPYYLNRLS